MKSANYYRRNNNGKPQFWCCNVEGNTVNVFHGILGGKIRTEEYVVTKKSADAEMKSRLNDKIKAGYITLSEVVDETGTPPVEDIGSPILAAYLERYLPYDLSNGRDKTILAMKAKTYTGKVWKKESVMLGQPKINGLRCLITASRNNDMFKPYALKFQSHEGVVWNTLGNLEDYLLSVLPASFVDNMIDEDWAMDGEVYLPGYSVNDINHFVKDATALQNKLLQYWCYDLAIEDMKQEVRDIIRYKIDHPTQRSCSNEHINNKERLIILDSIPIWGDAQSVKMRDVYLGCGYEGLILRNPNVEYQFGRRRVGYMEKFKTATEGDFMVVDIYKEEKRNLPILLCQNDVNDAKFETRLSETFEYQEAVLNRKNSFIGDYVHIEFSERSGVNKVPFHIKEVKFVKND